MTVFFLLLLLFVFNSNPASMVSLFTFFLSQLGINAFDGSISHKAVLDKVAEWARNNNRDDQSDPLQFDVAVLIRR